MQINIGRTWGRESVVFLFLLAWRMKFEEAENLCVLNCLYTSLELVAKL